MQRNVKNAKKSGSRRSRAVARGRISSKHQVTIPKEAFRKAGFRPGDLIVAESHGVGQVTFTRVEEIIDRYSGKLSSTTPVRDEIEALRDEWE